MGKVIVPKLQRVSLPGYQPLYDAQVLVLLSRPTEAPFSAVNTALAAENMLLQASGLGLGSCYIVSPTFEDAQTVFFDENAIEFDDPDHSIQGERFILLGLSQSLKISDL
jgi:nitroreductase